MFKSGLLCLALPKQLDHKSATECNLCAAGSRKPVCAGFGYKLSMLSIHKKQKIFSKNEKDLGMACHTQPSKKQGEMSLPSLGPI